MDTTILLVLLLLKVLVSSGSSSYGFLAAHDDVTSAGKVLNYMKEQNDDILQLRYNSINKCEVNTCVKSLYELLDQHPDILFLLVYGCTPVLKVISELAHFWNITMFGIGSSSAVLRNKQLYPTLQLLTEVENTHNPIRVQFLNTQQWSHVVTLSEDYEDYSVATDNIQKIMLNTSISIEQSLTLINTPTDITRKIQDLTTEDGRILVVFGSERVVEDLLLSMASREYLDTKRVIISNQPVKAVPNKVTLFYIGSSLRRMTVNEAGKDLTSTIAGLFRQIKSFLHQQPQLVNKISITNRFHYERDFPSKVYQYRHSSGQYVLIGSNHNDSLILNKSIHWQDGVKPLDKKKKTIRLNKITDPLFYLYMSICIIGIITGCLFIMINFKFKRHTLIKMSSPILNCVTVIGAILIYITVCLMGLDQPRIEGLSFRLICIFRISLLSVGYSLLLGPMCAKSFRVHSIMISSEQGKIIRKKLTDRYLLMFCGCLVILDIIVIIVWELAAPIYIKTTQLEQKEESSVDKSILLQTSKCTSNYINKWLGIIYAYKGVLLLLGTYLAWSTRNVSIPTLNDSKSIMLNIYLVFAASLIIVMVSLFVHDDATLSYSIVGCLILVSTTIMICILFLPKVVLLCKHTSTRNSNIPNPTLTSTGLITESNTKRLEVPKEERVREYELTIKIYKSEIQELEEEIDRLDSLLSTESFKITDVLREDYLYILPLPFPELDSHKLTRRHTPKYRQTREKQKQLLSKFQQQESSKNLLNRTSDQSNGHYTEKSLESWSLLPKTDKFEILIQ